MCCVTSAEMDYLACVDTASLFMIACLLAVYVGTKLGRWSRMDEMLANTQPYEHFVK